MLKATASDVLDGTYAEGQVEMGRAEEEEEGGGGTLLLLTWSYAGCKVHR